MKISEVKIGELPEEIKNAFGIYKGRVSGEWAYVTFEYNRVADAAPFNAFNKSIKKSLGESYQSANIGVNERGLTEIVFIVSKAKKDTLTYVVENFLKSERKFHMQGAEMTVSVDEETCGFVAVIYSQNKKQSEILGAMSGVSPTGQVGVFTATDPAVLKELIDLGVERLPEGSTPQGGAKANSRFQRIVKAG